MMLKWFFDFSTGFRHSIISLEYSVHFCSCPWLSASWITQKLSLQIPQNILNWFDFQTARNIDDNKNCPLCNKIIIMYPVFCCHYSLPKQDSNTLIRGMVMRTKNMHGILFFIWDGGQIEKKNNFTMGWIQF